MSRPPPKFGEIVAFWPFTAKDNDPIPAVVGVRSRLSSSDEIVLTPLYSSVFPTFPTAARRRCGRPDESGVWDYADLVDL